MKKISTLSLFFLVLTFCSVASATITITNLPNWEITKGQSIQLVATGGNPALYTWYSFNPAVATINSTTGLLTGVDTGAVMIAVADGTDSTNQVIFVRALKMWLPTVTMHVKDTVTIPLLVTNLTGLNLMSADINIQFDTNYIRLVGVDNAGTLTSSALVTDTVDSYGALKIGVASGTPIEGSDSVFVNLKFRAVDSTFVFTYTTLYLWYVNANELQLSVQLQNGDINFLNDPPKFTHVMPDTTILEGDTLRFTFSSFDPNGNTISYAVYGGPPAMYIDYYSGFLFWQTGYSDSGTYNLRVTSTDNFGDSTSHSLILHVLNVNRPPYFTSEIPLVMSSTEGLSDSLVLNAHDPDLDSITYSLSNAPLGMSISSSHSDTAMMKWNLTFNDSGTYHVTVHIADGIGGKDSITFTFTVADSNRAPVFTAVPHDTTINEGQKYTAQLKAVDPDLDSIYYYILSSIPPAGFMLDSLTGAISYTPTYTSAGVYNLVLAVTDSKMFGTSTTNFVLTVQDVNQPPTLTHTFPDTLFGSEGNLMQFNFDATDLDGDSLFFALVDTGLGMTMDSVTGLWEWIPTYNQAGSYYLHIKTQDIRGAWSVDSAFLFVKNINRAPVWTAFPPSFSVNEGDTLLLQYAAADPDSQSVHFLLSTSIAGMKIDSLTGIMKWIPTYFQGGQIYTAIVGVTDGIDTLHGNTSIDVFNVNLPPLFTATLPDTAIARFDTLKFHYAGLDQDSGTYSIYLYDSLSGASIDTNYWFTWVPPAGANGTYHVVTAISDGFATVLDTANVRINAYGDVSGNGTIGSYDASLILQDQVGRITLTTLQKLVGDVSGNDTITSFDASLILQYTVGIISTFPGGLGKHTIPQATLAPFSFRVEKGISTGDFDLVISLNKPSEVYGITSSILFDTSLVKPKLLKKESLTDSMAFSYFFPSGKANFSLAGVKPLVSTGDIARFSFTVKDMTHSPDEVLFTVGKFVLNETDFSNAIPQITLNVKQVFNIPETFALNQNYPNPFNPVTTISYQIPKQSMVTVKIYNMIGQEVKTLVNSEQEAGYYDVQWNATTDDNRVVSTGVYLYRIEARSGDKSPFVNIKKMILMK